MRTMLIAAAVAVLAHPAYAQNMGQVPTEKPEVIDPNPKTDYGCMREDQGQNSKQTMASAMAAYEKAQKAGTADDEAPVKMKSIAGCVYYRVSLRTKVLVEDLRDKDLTQAISGHGSVIFGLTPGQGSEYDFASDHSEFMPKIPVVWDRGSAKLTMQKCILTTVERPYTFYEVWLGVTKAGSGKLGLEVAPAGPDLHDVDEACQDITGKWHHFAQKQAVHAPAWMALYGEGKKKLKLSADQKAVTKAAATVSMGGTPPVLAPTNGIDANAQKMMDMVNSGATPEQIMKALQGDKGLNAQLAAAKDNFLFTSPGDCSWISATVATCQLNTKRELDSPVGYGTLKRITMNSTITIEKMPSRK